MAVRSKKLKLGSVANNKTLSLSPSPLSWRRHESQLAVISTNVKVLPRIHVLKAGAPYLALLRHMDVGCAGWNTVHKIRALPICGSCAEALKQQESAKQCCWWPRLLHLEQAGVEQGGLTLQSRNRGKNICVKNNHVYKSKRN